MAWCGSRWGSKTPTISSPTSSRRSPPADQAQRRAISVETGRRSIVVRDLDRTPDRRLPTSTYQRAISTRRWWALAPFAAMLTTMWDVFAALATALGVVFVAELGDKTQLLALGFGARYSLRTVAVGLTLGYAVAGAVAAIVGGLIGAALPERPVAIVSGVIFLIFAGVALRRSDEGDDQSDEAHERTVTTRSAVVTIALTIALGEMGDKTQLATATLATQANPVATWAGATIGATSAGMIGAFAGQRLGSRLDRGVLRYVSAALFALFGVLLLLSAR